MTATRPDTSLTVLVLRWLKRWKLELAVAATAAIAKWIVAVDASPDAATLCYLGAAGLLAAHPGLRDPVKATLGQRARARRWDRALDAIVAWPDTPTVLWVEASPLGEHATVAVRAGTTIGELADRAEHLAAAFGVNDVRVTRHPTNAALGEIRTLRVDPLAGTPSPWPWLARSRVSLWEPVPVGVDETGDAVAVTLFEHNILVGGEPGSGKSVAVSQLVAAAALDPAATLWLLDGKLVELAAWRPVAHLFAGTDITDATASLTDIQQIMDDRYQLLLDGHLRKAPHGAGLHVVVIDELAHYLTWPDKKPRDAFSDLLRDLVSRGRAAGVVVIAATQKPGSDIIPTSIRDLFGYRWALRCTTPAASDTILGTGWATQGYTTSTINPALRGAGYLLHETGLPLRLRSHHLGDADIERLVARAIDLRRHAAATDTPGEPRWAGQAPTSGGENGN